MTTMRAGRPRVWRGLACSAGLLGGAYAAYAGWTWLRFGHATPAPTDDQDALLDGFMPTYDIVERHHARVVAPAAVTFAAACAADLEQSAVVRAIFRARQLSMRGRGSVRAARAAGVVQAMQAIGWRVLAETPGRELIFGAVTRPWEANVVFRSIAAEQFASFGEPDYVKIVWTLRADPSDEGTSIFCTETRAVATDSYSRSRFRRYWSMYSPGIVLIRRLLVAQVRRAAEARVGKVANDGGRPCASGVRAGIPRES